MWRMRYFLLMIVVVMGCGKKTPQTPPESIPTPKGELKETEPPKGPIESAIRKELKKPNGELTKEDLEKVTFLNLDNTKITNAGLKELAKLQQITRLWLFNTQITDAGLKEVAKLKQLEGLNLVRTQITNTGLKEVAKLKQLEVLYLFHSNHTAGVAELQKALPKCRIHHDFN